MEESVATAEPLPAADEARLRTATSAMLAGVVLVCVAILFLWFAPGSYQILLALHVLAVVIWVGGDVTLTTLGVVFERKGDGEALAALGKLGGWIGPRLYTPVLFAAFGLGVALVEKGNWGWNHFWIDFALAGWALTATVGIAFIGPELGRIGALAAQIGPDAPEVGGRVNRLFMIFRGQTVLLMLIVIDMVAKPSF
ncbi:MAG TPA: hypothetical protein VID68_01315 [Solirubrobacteraceae bacterium]|jgi:uncharacterized membrane protein